MLISNYSKLAFICQSDRCVRQNTKVNIYEIRKKDDKSDRSVRIWQAFSMVQLIQDIKLQHTCKAFELAIDVMGNMWPWSHFKLCKQVFKGSKFLPTVKTWRFFSFRYRSHDQNILKARCFNKTRFNHYHQKPSWFKDMLWIHGSSDVPWEKMTCGQKVLNGYLLFFCQ